MAYLISCRESIISIQSSLKSHALWVTLHINVNLYFINPINIYWNLLCIDKRVSTEKCYARCNKVAFERATLIKIFFWSKKIRIFYVRIYCFILAQDCYLWKHPTAPFWNKKTKERDIPPPACCLAYFQLMYNVKFIMLNYLV